MEPQFTSSTHRQHMSDRTKLYTIYMDIESLMMNQFYSIYLLASRIQVSDLIRLHGRMSSETRDSITSAGSPAPLSSRLLVYSLAPELAFDL